MQQERFSFRKRLKSFKFAFNGLRILIREEHNARIHLVIGILAVVAGFLLGISNLDWIAIVFAIGLVISLELVNSSIEGIADFISPGSHEMIKKIKDLSAAAVLIGAITAIITGLIVFLPKILALC